MLNNNYLFIFYFKFQKVSNIKYGIRGKHLQLDPKGSLRATKTIETRFKAQPSLCSDC